VIKVRRVVREIHNVFITTDNRIPILKSTSMSDA
jgi:hypothetical protein